MDERGLEPTPRLPAPKLVHLPLHQATNDSSLYCQTRSTFMAPYSINDTTIPLVRWTKFLGVCLDASWSLIIAHVPFITHCCLFHLWNITESHPLLFLSTSTILVQVDIVFPWTPLLGSPTFTLMPSDLVSRMLPMWSFWKTNVIPCWKPPDTVWPFPTPPNTDSHPFLLPLSWSTPFLGKLSLTSLDHLNPPSTISWQHITI